MNRIVVAIFFALTLMAGNDADKSFGRSGLINQCAVTVVYLPARLERGLPLAVGAFPIAGASNYKPDDEDPAALLTAELKKQLEKKYFSSVERTGAAPPEKGYILEGEFLSLSKGSRAGRIALGSEAGKPALQIRARLFRLPDRAQPVAELDCDSNRVIKVGSSVIWNRAKSGDSVLRHEFEDAARTFGKELEIAEKLIQHRASSPVAKPLEGGAKDASAGVIGGIKNLGGKPAKLIPGLFKRNKGKEQPEKETSENQNSAKRQEAAEEDADDVTAEAGGEDADGADEEADLSIREYWKQFREATVVASKRQRRVEAVWMTTSAYGAHTRLLAKLGEKRTIRDDELRNGLVGAASALQELANQDVYVLAVSFEKLTSLGPMLWNTDRLKKSATIRNISAGRNTAPVEVIDPAVPGGVRRNTYWQARRVLFAFPATVDGQPLIDGLNDTLEFSAEYDAAPVLLRFRPADLGASDMKDIKMR